MSGDTGETQSADLRWVLSELASGTPVGSIELTGRLSEASQAAELRSRLTLGQAQAALSGPDFDVLAVEAAAPDIISAHLRGGNNREWRLGALVDSGHGGRIRRFYFAPWSSDVTVRPATEEDGPLFAEIERKAPIVVGETSKVYDRGADDYFKGERLMGSADMRVLERDGEPIGVVGNVIHDLRLNGRVLKASYGDRIRVSKEAQGSGALAAMSWASFRASAPSDGAYGFVAAENTAMLQVFPPQLIAPVRPQRVILSAVDQPVDRIGRRATAADAERIVGLLNDTRSDGSASFPTPPTDSRSGCPELPTCTTGRVFESRRGRSWACGPRRSA